MQRIVHQEGDWVIGLYDFTATVPEQLTIQQDDRLRIVEGTFLCCIPSMQLLTRCLPVLVETAVKGWYLVEDESGAEGLVPENYLELGPSIVWICM